MDGFDGKTTSLRTTTTCLISNKVYHPFGGINRPDRGHPRFENFAALPCLQEHESRKRSFGWSHYTCTTYISYDNSVFFVDEKKKKHLQQYIQRRSR